MRCLAIDVEDGLLDILGVHSTRQDAAWELLIEEYHDSLEPPDAALVGMPEHENPTIE